MKYLLLNIILISYSSVLGYEMIDDIHKISVETNWTEIDDYFKSDVNIHGYGVPRDYGNYIFWKYQFWGWFIDKETGNVFKKIEQNPVSVPGFFYHMNWDLSPTDSSKIIAIEYGHRTGHTNSIIAYKNNESETLFTWVTDGRDLFPDSDANPFFYALTDEQFLDQHDHIRIDGSYDWRVTAKNFIDLTKPDSIRIRHMNEINLLGLRTNISKDLFVFTDNNIVYDHEGKYNNENSIDIMTYTNSTFERKVRLTTGESSLFTELINDSVLALMYKDTLVLYDHNNKNTYTKHPTNGNETPIGIYWSEDKKTVDVAFVREGDSCNIMSIHYPSKNVVKRERVVAPYLGRFVMNTGDGYTLSVGQDGLLYKHDLSVFKTDSLTADFSYKNTANYELHFTDESFGAVTDWRWNFGDGGVSTERHPGHKFASAGNYDVELIVTDEYGNKDSITKQVKVTQKLKASFDFGVFSGQAPFTVQFKNYSSDNAVRYIWNFGDGTYSYEMEPAHTYSIPGKYSISLTVFDENEKFHTIVQSKNVVVTE
ncbi:MAG: PKD domain-containing protein [Chlorobiota bacterium]